MPMKREDIFARDRRRCVYCGAVEADGVRLSVDHVEPRYLGGDDSHGNVVTACRDCNREKGHLAAWAYLARRDAERAHFLDHATYVWPRLRDAIREAAAKAGGRETDA